MRPRDVFAIAVATIATPLLGAVSIAWGQYLGDHVGWFAEFIVYAVAGLGAGAAWFVIAKFIAGWRW